MARFFAHMEYWEKYPPTHVLVRNIAMWLGAYKPKGAAGAQQISLEQFRAQNPNGL